MNRALAGVQSANKFNQMRKALIISFLIAGFSSFAQDSMPDWALGPFVRPVSVNPVISPKASSMFNCPMLGKQVAWEVNDTFNPAATVKDGKIYVLYRAEDNRGEGIGNRTSRIGLAESSDGFKMKRSDKPVLFPANDNQKEHEWFGGCEDPRVAATEDGRFIMLYTMWNNKIPRLGVAISRDLKTWTKHGAAFAKAGNGQFYNIPSKSASIATKLKNGKQVITKVNGRFWMYWGEENVYAATSNDLINWQPLVDEKGNLKKLMTPRPGYFDSQLTECGPPAIITDKGIVLLYNGKNLAINGDKNYTPNTYCAGQALFDAENPEKLIARLDKPFLIPSESFEKSGQYPAGTVFIEGMAYFKNRWYLYYGAADSRVAVAVFNPEKKSER